ncbi:pentapeptide repeat-containing protein [Streptosporangium sp. NPDC000095]|uniref:pentapeptide repeat-containing protein n=1 Tax=Streptosporangium sp. NPDC000095 TaxID=3366184 RepID=UPI00368293C3
MFPGYRGVEGLGSASLLRGSVLRGSVLRGSVLRGSVLRGSVLRGSDPPRFLGPRFLPAGPFPYSPVALPRASAGSSYSFTGAPRPVASRVRGQVSFGCPPGRARSPSRVRAREKPGSRAAV